MAKAKTAREARLERDRNARRKKKIVMIVQYVLAVTVTVIILFPLYWMISSSFKSQEEILLPIPTLWPKEFHPENYISVFRRGNFAKYYYK